MTAKTRPALKWLIKNDPEAALAVFHRLRDEHYAYGRDPDVEQHLTPAEHNADDVDTHAVPDRDGEAYTSETMYVNVDGGPDELQIEMLHEFKPELHVMLRSAGGIAWPWCGVRWIRRGKNVWVGEPWAYTWSVGAASAGGNVIIVGGLTFYAKPGARKGHAGGMLLSYVDVDGKVQRPEIKTAKPRGGKRPLRANPAAYLALPAAIPSPLSAEPWRVPFSDSPMLGDFYHPLPRKAPGYRDRLGRYGVAEARAELTAMGIDGNVKFRDIPFAGTKLPTGRAKDVRFIGGLMGVKQTTSVATIGKAEEAEPLDPVLQQVQDRGTLASIGIKLGYSPSYADRAAKRELLRIGRDLVAANENFYKRVAA